MTDVYEYDDDDTDETQDDKPQRTDSEWAELRRAKKAAEKAQKELAALKAEREFEKAGLDMSDPKAAYFRKGYEGELTAEAIRAEAINAGFVQEQTEPEPDLTPVDAQARIAQAAGGLGTDQPEIAQAALDQAFAEGGTEGMLQFLASQGIPLNTTQ